LTAGRKFYLVISFPVWPSVLTNLAIHHRLGKLLLPPTTIKDRKYNHYSEKISFLQKIVLFALYILSFVQKIALPSPPLPSLTKGGGGRGRDKP